MSVGSHIESLSQSTLVGRSIGTPNIRNLYYKLSMRPTAIQVTKSLEPKVEVSTMFCCLLYQIIGALLTNKVIPVCEHHVTLSPAGLASTKQDMATAFPCGLKAFGGNGCFTRRISSIIGCLHQEQVMNKHQSTVDSNLLLHPSGEEKHQAHGGSHRTTE